MASSSRRRRIVLAAVVVLPAWLVPTCVVGTYVIRSDSMSPTLQEGDHLLVLRDGVDPRDLRRWDVVVMDRSVDAQVPEAYEAVVKRVAALGGERAQVRDGDLWIGRGDDGLALAAKPDGLVRQLLSECHAGVGLSGPWGVSGPHEVLADGVLRLDGEGGPVTARFGRAVIAGDSRVRDTAIEVRVGAVGGTLTLGLREGADVFRARLGGATADGPAPGASLVHNLGGGELVTAPDFAGLRPGDRILFWNVDDRLRLFVNDRLVLGHDGAANADQHPGTTFVNTPELSVQGGHWTIEAARVLRDVHYGADGTYGTGAGGLVATCRVLPGEVYLLGDASDRSRDSRHFGAVPVAGLLGRPLATYRPWARAGWHPSLGTTEP